MPNLYDIYLQFKAIGAVEYKNELLIFSKEIDTIFSQESVDGEYSTYLILPYHRIAAIMKNDIAKKEKSLLHKIINGEILFDNLDFIVKLQNYIRFLLGRKEENVDFAFVRGQLSAINNAVKEYDSLRNPHLKGIYLSVIKQKAISLYDNLYFDKEKIVTQIEKSASEIGEKQFLAINKLINLTSRADTPKLEKTIANLIAQNPVLSYYQSISSVKDFELSKQIFTIIKTIYPYEDILFDLKIPFEQATGSKLYAKYDSVQEHIVFEIITDNKEERHTPYNRLTAALQKYMDKNGAKFKIWLTDDYPDIWSLELSDLNAKQSLNSDMHDLMFAFKKHWTQDYAVSIAIVIISKILYVLYENESKCSEIINVLYENWFIFLFEDNTTTNIYQFNKNKEFRTASLMKQVESMSNDMALLAGFFQNGIINKYTCAIQELVTNIIEKQFKHHIEKENAVLGLLEETCSSLGVYKKNIPYIALLIKTYRETLWKII
ncbi:MAG: hypothetical protein LBV02_06705 [Bacteroidales bacterium]|jgi:hypothetical protein|nr:hypothetical protein [Bacteroidales bacterium]